MRWDLGSSFFLLFFWYWFCCFAVSQLYPRALNSNVSFKLMPTSLYTEMRHDLENIRLLWAGQCSFKYCHSSPRYGRTPSLIWTVQPQIRHLYASDHFRCSGLTEIIECLGLFVLPIHMRSVSLIRSYSDIWSRFTHAHPRAWFCHGRRKSITDIL